MSASYQLSLSFIANRSPVQAFQILDPVFLRKTCITTVSYFASVRLPSLSYFSIGSQLISFVAIQSKRLLRASARLLSFSRVYNILNLYYPSSSNYLTCLLLSAFIVVKLNRFLQLVYIISSEQLSVYCLYCSKVLTTTNNSLSCISQFCSTKDIFLKKQATRCYFLSLYQYKYAPTARSNTSVLILAGSFALKLCSTSGFTHTSFSFLNAFSCSFPYQNSFSFFVASVNRSAFFEYSLINCRLKLANSRKL